jgi:hypothetical protein
MRDVTDRFHVTDIDSTELGRHLMGAFNHAAFSALDRIDIPDAEAPTVQIYYSPAGAITKIVTSLTDEELRPYIDELEKLFLSPTHQQVQRFIGFANAPVNGTWECEAFTITAAPPEAPRPQQVPRGSPIYPRSSV